LTRTTKPYHHGDLRNDLLKAGMDLLKQHGQSAVTTRDCAKIVGCAPSAVFRHFADRKAFITGLATEGFTLLGTRMTAAVETVDKDVQHRVAARTYIDFGMQEPHLFRLMFQGDLIDIEDPDLRAASEFLRNDAALANPTAPNQKDDEAVLAWAIVHGLASLAIDSQLCRGLPNDAKQRTDALMRILDRTASPFKD
jgi:AcrR family transcriptional regulator